MLRRSVLIAVSLTLAPMAALAGSHPEATLKAARSSVNAGTALPVTGENFAASSKVLLALRGALDEYQLGEATATAEGTLSLPLDIPLDVRPGRYQLVAVADDGDVVARLDMTVEPALKPAGEAPVGSGEMAVDMQMASEHESMAMPGDLPIQRSSSGVEWGIIGLLVGLAGGLGLGLFRRPA